MDRSEGRESGIGILGMNSGRTVIGRRRIGNGNVGAVGGFGMGPAVTRWDTARLPGSTHRSAQMTRCQCTARLTGIQKKV